MSGFVALLLAVALIATVWGMQLRSRHLAIMMDAAIYKELSELYQLWRNTEALPRGFTKCDPDRLKQDFRNHIRGGDVFTSNAMDHSPIFLTSLSCSEGDSHPLVVVVCPSGDHAALRSDGHVVVLSDKEFRIWKVTHKPFQLQ